MRPIHFITAALLTISASSASGFGLNFYHPSPTLGGFKGFKIGMVWGIVVNTTPDSFDFSALDSLNIGQLPGGVGASGQWLTDNLVYLTDSDGSANSPLSLIGATFPPDGTGAITGISGLSYNITGNDGNPYTLQPDSTFALIWFDIQDLPSNGSNSVIPDPDEDEYGFLTVADKIGENGEVIPGFRIPSGDTNSDFYHLAEDNSYRSTTPFSPIPEPSTYALLLSGLVLGFCALRRRSKKVAA